MSPLKLRDCASDLVLRTYTEEPIKVIGTLNVRVQYGSQAEKLVLVVVGGDGPSLFGPNSGCDTSDLTGIRSG